VPRDVDALTSSTLKHLREHWWSAEFTDFLRETLQPRAGNRILDVGCGVGTAEVQLGQLGISQVRLFGADLIAPRVVEAVAAARAHNIRARFTVADACRLPFASGAFDSTFCVAVLQHLRDVAAAVGEFARVTRPGGRVLVVEPDNAARYWYSTSPLGRRAFDVATRFFNAIDGRGYGTDPAVGPKIPEILARHGLEPAAIRVFPVCQARMGSPDAAVWDGRRATVRGAIDRLQDPSLRQLGEEYLRVVDEYAAEAQAAGKTFVEIQNTMLFATVGMKPAA